MQDEPETPGDDGPETPARDESEIPAGEPEAPVGPTSDAALDAAEPTEHKQQLEAAEPTEHEQQLERDLDELTAKAEKADEYLELARRLADFCAPECPFINPLRLGKSQVFISAEMCLHCCRCFR